MDKYIVIEMQNGAIGGNNWSYDSKADAWLDLKETLARFLPVRYQRFRGKDYTDYSFRKER